MATDPKKPAPLLLWLLEFDTRHYSFSAVGTSIDECLQALVSGWALHAEQSEADPDYVRDNLDSICLMPTYPGVLLRDREVIGEALKKAGLPRLPVLKQKDLTAALVRAGLA